jgi:hypothetical protein
MYAGLTGQVTPGWGYHIRFLKGRRSRLGEAWVGHIFYLHSDALLYALASFTICADIAGKMQIGGVFISIVKGSRNPIKERISPAV